MFRPFTFSILGLLAFFIVPATAGNTTCSGNLTDWYTTAVGETACETYQRLRQICNPYYQVPSFRPNTPGDDCDDQLADCCCNSISWALSMLCMNCQWDVIGGSANGIDAGIGAYGLYRNSSGAFCNPGTNQSLPANIQTAACNAGIKLDNFLYELFWNDGSWFFIYTTEYAVEQQVQFNNNTFTHCNSTTTTSALTAVSTSLKSAVTSISPTTTTTTTPSTSPSHANTTSVIGGVVGGVGGLALILGIGFVYWRKRNHPQHVPRMNGSDYMASIVTPHPPDDPFQSSSGLIEQSRRHPAFTHSSSERGPHSDAGASYAPQGASSVPLSDPPVEPARHEDLGPMTMLERSLSGSLPPAYNPQWEPEARARSRPLPQPTAASVVKSTTITQPWLQ